MVLWIGVDDTDSLRGMCTTFLATELVRELTQEYDLIGYPRLVRLNPNIPWKTRGNGAICLRVGRGMGSRQVVGNIESKDVVAFARASGPSDLDRVRDVVAEVVERWSRFEDDTTNPGFAVLRRPPTARLYWMAVRTVVDQSDASSVPQGWVAFMATRMVAASLVHLLQLRGDHGTARMRFLRPERCRGGERRGRSIPSRSSRWTANSRQRSTISTTRAADR